MADDENYSQCLLLKDNQRQVAWIPSRGAKVGYKVELLPEGEFWQVSEVYSTLPKRTLQEQESGRRTLRSIR
jgi:hypothetical protein